MFPAEGGYGRFLHGKVVDMLFFPLWHNETGEVMFFQPVFNIADSSITIGVLNILFFQRRYFNGTEDTPESPLTPEKQVAETTENADNQDITTEIVENTEGVTEDKKDAV